MYEDHPGNGHAYDRHQPRVPAGHRDGGQWTRVGGETGDQSEVRRRWLEIFDLATADRARVGMVPPLAVRPSYVPVAPSVQFFGALQLASQLKVPGQQIPGIDVPSEGGAGRGPGGGLSGGGSLFERPASNVSVPYSRPPNATSRQQRDSVQGRRCTDCGKTRSRMNANHVEPLVEEYYRTGTINRERMQSLDAVNAHCPTCSASQGGYLSNYAKAMKKLLGF